MNKKTFFKCLSVAFCNMVIMLLCIFIATSGIEIGMMHNIAAALVATLVNTIALYEKNLHNYVRTLVYFCAAMASMAPLFFLFRHIYWSANDIAIGGAVLSLMLRFFAFLGIVFGIVFSFVLSWGTQIFLRHRKNGNAVQSDIQSDLANQGQSGANTPGDKEDPEMVRKQRTPHAAKPRAKWMKICYTGSAEQGRGTVCCCEHDFRTRLGCL